MGRGRAKAKQTKVARRLKYQTLETDFSALQRELSAGERAELEAQQARGEVLDDADAAALARAYEEDDDSEDDDPYAAYVEDDDEDEATPRVS